MLPLFDVEYPFEDGEHHIKIRAVTCDSGGAKSRTGEGSVTNNAYNFWRKLRDTPELHHLVSQERFYLIKGQKGNVGKAVQKRFPDNTNRSDRKADAKGEIPIYFIKTDTVKDIVDNDLNRIEAGPGSYHFPVGTPLSYFEELTAETKHPTKGWINETRKPNEAFDLCCYMQATLIMYEADKINWDNPKQSWQHGIGSDVKNPFIRYPDEEKQLPQTASQPVRPRGRRVYSRGI